jgi:RAB protein geranylgeranyltransferase component A
MKSMLLRLVPREEQGKLRLHSQSFIVTHDRIPIDAAIESLAVKDNDNTVKDKISNESMDETISSIQQQPPSSSQPLENGFCLDLTPTLLYASGDAVECLVKSGVSDYLEFKSLKGLYLLTEEEKPTIKTGGVGRQSKNTANSHDTMSMTNNDQLMLYRVPCSKGDVFRSKLLSPMDKRRLMKFLQLISDYGMSVTGVTTTSLDDDMKSDDEELDSNTEPMTRESGGTGEDVIQSINERHLHRGRALSRPQNKATPSTSEMDALMRCVRENLSFTDFLTQVAKLPAKLVTVVMYALALTPFGQSQYSTVAGLDDLVRHMTALGRFGDTAFLVPMYGSGELSQAFCRSGAVYGSTYMLRRSPLAVVLDVSANNVKGVLLSGEEHIGGGSLYDLDTNDTSDKEFKCKHIVVPSTMLLPPLRRSQETRTYRRISILQGKLMQEEDQNNGGVVDSEQRHAIVIPPGICGMENRSAIHGVTLDDTAFVAPAGKNYTVLHLTTTSSRQEGEILPDEVIVNALSQAVTYLTTSQCANDSAPCVELHHISFSYAIDVSNTIDENTKSADYPVGLHICHRDIQSLTCDSSFREAERIFHAICPDCDFLTLAKKVEDAIVYRNEDDGDDENAVLESACTMISTTIDNGDTVS